MPFIQVPPQLDNQYLADRVLRSYLRRALPGALHAAIEPQLARMGELAGGALYRQSLAERALEPVLIQWDAWGNRVDRVEVTPLWREAQRLAAREGLVAIAYERDNGPHSRVHQFALAYLFTPSTDLYACPLAMTDGAARVIADSNHAELKQQALPRLLARDPAVFWTSGQWMTEIVGGSDVGQSETEARRDADGRWRLFGRKWFVSAADSPMALTLARPRDNPQGGKGLALFWLRTRSDDGLPLQGIRYDRLKDKLGTRKVPTAEVTLEGALAEPVMELANGVRHIASMLNVTRAWNTVAAVALMRRGLALARDYAGKRIAFGAPLARQPLHTDTLAGVTAEFEGAFHLGFALAELMGKLEAGEATEAEASLYRALTPLAKLTTGKQCVDALSEIVESFGGAGYVEDTGLPALLRDAHVLPIWEGTTNVLSLDLLRALSTAPGLAVLRGHLDSLLTDLRDPGLIAAAAKIGCAIDHACDWYASAAANGEDALQAGARRFALTLGRSLEAGLLARHAQWSLDIEGSRHALAATRRLALSGLDLIADTDPEDAALLAGER